MYLGEHCSCEHGFNAVRYNNTERTYLYNDTFENNDDIERLTLLTTTYKIARGTFRNLTDLREIELNDAGIHIIEPGFSEFTPKLKRFNAQRNHIQIIEKNVFNTHNLTVIDISSNKIFHIDDEAFSSMNLTYLCLSDNNLKTINSTWFNDTEIIALAITHNEIVSLTSNTFDGIVKLITLKLDFNKIHYIEENTFSKQCCLIKLYLPGNFLTNVKFITDTMEKLDVSLNMINSIILQNATALRRIYIYPNPWACKCLRKFWKQVYENYIYIGETYSLKVPWKDEYPVCVAFDIQCNTDNLIVGNFMHASYYNIVKYTDFGKYIYSKQDDFADMGDYIFWFYPRKY